MKYIVNAVLLLLMLLLHGASARQLMMGGMGKKGMMGGKGKKGKKSVFRGMMGKSPSSGPKARRYKVKIVVTNMAPENGTRQTPVWIGLHDGTFDLYNRGEMVSPALERLAEDGTTAPLSEMFLMSPGAVWDGVVGDGPIQPQTSAELEFRVMVKKGMPLYLSYATMVLPSNDAFLANGDPMAHLVFKSNGKPARFQPVMDMGSDVLDAGSEVNDEATDTTAFFGQMMPDTGTVEGGVVELHPGFMPSGSGGILDDAMFSNADFTQAPYPMLKIQVRVYKN